MPTANWPLSAIFILLLFLPPDNIIINLVHTCLRTHNAKGGGRQAVQYVYAVPWLIFLTRQLQRERDQTL